MLVAANGTVVDVATNFTKGGATAPRPRKDDEGEAVVIARVALHEPDPSRMDAAQLDADLQFLVGAGDQFGDEQTPPRWLESGSDDWRSS